MKFKQTSAFFKLRKGALKKNISKEKNSFKERDSSGFYNPVFKNNLLGRKVWKQSLKFFSLPAFREENLVKLSRVFKFSLTRKCLVYFISVQITKSLTLKCTFACCSFFSFFIFPFEH